MQIWGWGYGWKWKYTDTQNRWMQYKNYLCVGEDWSKSGMTIPGEKRMGFIVHETLSGFKPT